MVASLLLGAALVALLAAGALLVAGVAQDLARWQQRRQRQPLLCRVVSRRDITPELVVLELQPRGWHHLPRWRAGQHLLLTTPIGQRAYSIANGHGRRWQLAIRVQGRVSGWLAQHALVGSVLPVSRPQGHYQLPKQLPPELVLIGAGVGITPMRAIVHQLQRLRRPPRVVLHQVARHRDGLLWADEFRALAAAHRWFSYQPRLTGASAPDCAHGRPAAVDLMAGLDQPTTAHYWCCASNEMMESLGQQLQQLGVSAEQWQIESFSAPSNSDNSSYPVTVAGQQLTFAGAPSLLHGLEAAGIAIDADCRGGSCGRCQRPLLAGEVRYVIAPQCTVAANQVLTCCAVPTSAITLG